MIFNPLIIISYAIGSDVNALIPDGVEATVQESLQIPKPLVDYIDNDPFSGKYDQLNHLSKYAWVACGESVWVLPCLGKAAIRIEKKVAGGDFQGSFPHDFRAQTLQTLTPYNLDRSFKPGDNFYVATLIRSADGKPQGVEQHELLVARSLDQALNWCDQYARNKVVFGPLGLG